MWTQSLDQHDIGSRHIVTEVLNELRSTLSRLVRYSTLGLHQHFDPNLASSDFTKRNDRGLVAISV